MRSRVVRRSCRRPGRLVPPAARRLRSRAILLRPGRSVGWHSTQRREELLVVLSGSVQLEYGQPGPRRRVVQLGALQCAFIPSRTRHRVINRSRPLAHYLYITG